MGVIEEEPSHIQSGSTRKRDSRDKEKPHLREEEEAKKKKIIGMSENIKSLADLPSNVLVEILARLPLRTLFVARSVCKTFISLTTPNPHFINLRSSYAAQVLVFQFGVSHEISSLLRIADDEQDYKYSQLKPFLFQLPKVGTAVKPYDTYLLVNSCNGLLYFVRNGAEDFHSLFCNPVTSEYIIIPDVVVTDPRMCLLARAENLWLGFSPGTDQYKVLRTFCWKSAAGPLEFAAQVYVIGSDSWRDIDDTPPWRHLHLHLGQTIVNGIMYWHYAMWPSVAFFDFEREKFGEVAFPAEFQNEEFTKTKHEMSIGVLGGCLCLSCNDKNAHRLYLWVMRMCGNRESWTKDFVVDTVTLGPVCGWFMPLQFLRNGEILMQLNRSALVCYDPRTETLRYFSLHRENFGYRVFALTPSFVPLKDALKVEEVFRQLRPRGDEKELTRGGNTC